MAENRLSSEFLKELFNVATRNKQVAAILAEHLKEEFLPDKEYINLFKSVKAHYIKRKNNRKLLKTRSFFNSRW